MQSGNFSHPGALGAIWLEGGSVASVLFEGWCNRGFDCACSCERPAGNITDVSTSLGMSTGVRTGDGESETGACGPVLLATYHALVIGFGQARAVGCIHGDADKSACGHTAHHGPDDLARETHRVAHSYPSKVREANA